MRRSAQTANLVGGLVLIAALAACGGGKPQTRDLEALTAEEIYTLGEFELANSRKPDRSR